MYLRLLKFLVKERLRHVLSPVAEPKQWCRVVMDQETDRLVKELPYRDYSVLEISGRKWENFGFREYQSEEFPGFDVCKDKLDVKYDLIIAEQVFEHLLYPHRAARNVYDMLKPNGYFLITTPFLIKVHLFPVDCTRWTDTGLKYFLEEAGFDRDMITTGAWGNLEAVVSNLNQWTAYLPGIHSLKNEQEYPTVVWGLARKK
jgi:SAM-dependent methyltransferase